MQISFTKSFRSTEMENCETISATGEKQHKNRSFLALCIHMLFFESCHRASTGGELKRIEQIVRQSEQWQQ